MGFSSFKSYGTQFLKTKINTPPPTQPPTAPTTTPPTVPQTPIFKYGFNSSLVYDEISQRDNGINHGATLDNENFRKGTGSAKFIGNDTNCYVSTTSFPIYMVIMVILFLVGLKSRLIPLVDLPQFFLITEQIPRLSSLAPTIKIQIVCFFLQPTTVIVD